MELELYTFVYCQATWSISIGKLLTVRTDISRAWYIYTILLFQNGASEKVILSAYRFVIEHILGDQNIVADGLTRANTLIFNDVDKSKLHLYQNDIMTRIFRLGVEGIEEPEIPGVVNEVGESGGEEKYGIIERHVKSLQDIITLSWDILAWSAL